MLIQVLAALALLAVLWMLFRFAMGLRFAKVAREEARRGAEARGRRVVAEIPLGETLTFFQEDDERFYWGEQSVDKDRIRGARLLLNGGVIGSFSRDGAGLPESPSAEDYEGRERWEVVLHLEGGAVARVSCGALREGVSREIAGRVFEAARRAAERRGAREDEP